MLSLWTGVSASAPNHRVLGRATMLLAADGEGTTATPNEAIRWARAREMGAIGSGRGGRFPTAEEILAARGGRCGGRPSCNWETQGGIYVCAYAADTERQVSRRNALPPNRWHCPFIMRMIRRV